MKTKRGSSHKIQTIPDKRAIDLIEKLSELEHLQWIHYSKNVSRRIEQAKTLDQVKASTVNRWRASWKEYSKLSSKEKEKDRIWALKVLEILRSHKDEVISLFESAPHPGGPEL